MPKIPNRKTLTEKAVKNVSVVKKTASGTQKVVKKGVPNEHTTNEKTSKMTPHNKIVGMSKGVTKNMDNYESLRVDCWLSDSVKDGETEVQAFDRIESVIDEVLEKAILNTIEE